MPWNLIFLIVMAALEWGQATVDLWHGDIPRAVIMLGAGCSSIALMYL